MTWTRRFCCAPQLLGLLCLSCSETDRIQIHPIGDEWISSFEQVDVARQPDWLRRLASSIDNAQLDVVIGETASPAGGELAMPSSVAESALGGVYLLDAGLGELRIYNWDGALSRTIAMSGAGPTEILNPLTMQVLPSSDSLRSTTSETVEILQRVGLKRFKVFRDSVVLLSQFLPPTMPLAAGACTNKMGTFARRTLAIDSGLAFRFDTGGARMTRFGHGYEHGSSNLREEISKGLIACNADGLILLAFRYLPRLELYDWNGSLIWHTNLPDFNAPKFEERLSTGGALNRLLNDGGSMVHEVRALPQGGFIVQVFNVNAAVPGERVANIRSRSTFLVAPESPVPVTLQHDHGELVGVTRSHIWTRRESEQGAPIVEGFRYDTPLD